MFIQKKTKKLLFQLFSPHPHPYLEGILINLYTGHSTYFETKYKSFFSFIFKQLLQKMFDMRSMSIVN